MYQQNEIKISDAEWLIMQAVWDKSPLYMGDIVKALSHTPWARATIQTMVARLISKNVIGTNRNGYAFLYYPVVTKEDAVKMYTKSFIDRVYNGDISELVNELASDDYLTTEEKKAIKKML